MNGGVDIVYANREKNSRMMQGLPERKYKIRKRG